MISGADKPMGEGKTYPQDVPATVLLMVYEWPDGAWCWVEDLYRKEFRYRPPGEVVPYWDGI